MIEQDNQTAIEQRKPKARNFYILHAKIGEKRKDILFVNEALLCGSAGYLAPPKGKRGFPVYPEVPRFIIGKLGKKASAPTDFELFHSYWLVSDRLKQLFEQLDPEAFAFLPCDVRLADGSPGPPYWLCDIVRVLEAFDQSTSDDLRRNPTRGVLGYYHLVFNEDAIGSAHIFRTPYKLNIFADQSVKDACQRAGIKGAKFTACFKQ